MKISVRGFTGEILRLYARTEEQYIRDDSVARITSYDIELLIQEAGIKTVSMENVRMDEIKIEK